VGNKCTSAPSIASLEGAGYSLPTLASSDFFEITLSANVTATTGSVSNVAAVSSTTTDPTPGNNSATDTDTVNERADLQISKTDGVTSVNAGGSTTYTIRVTNNGPSSVTFSTLTDAAASATPFPSAARSRSVGNKCTSAPSIAS